MLNLLVVSLCVLQPLDLERVERLGADGQPDVAYLPKLVPYLKNADERTRGLAALAISRHVGAAKENVPVEIVAGLVDRLDDANLHIAGLCRRSLATLGPLAVPGVAAWMTQPERSVRERRLAIEACRVLSPQPGVEAVLWRALHDPDAGVAERARVTILGWPPRVIREPLRDRKLLREAALTADPRIRELAFEQLERLEVEGFATLAVLSESARPEVRGEALRCAARLIRRSVFPGPAEARVLLARLELEPTHDLVAIRRSLQQVLGLSDRETQESARRVDAYLVVWGQEKANRLKLLLALSGEGAMGLRWLEDRVSFGSQPQRLAALEVLAERREVWRPTPAMFDTLAVTIYHPEEVLALAAVRAVRAAARPELHASPTMVAALKSALGSTSAEIRHHAVFAFAGLGLTTEPALVPLFRAKEEPLRRSAVGVVREWHQHGLLARKCEPELDRLAGEAGDEGAAAGRVLAGLRASIDLESVAPRQRQQALRTIERLGAEGQRNASYLPGLAKLLAANDLPTRGLAALAIARHAPAVRAPLPGEVILAVVARLHDENPQVAAYCRAALRDFGVQALPGVRLSLEPSTIAGSEAVRLDGLEACRVLMAVAACRAEAQTLLWQALLDEHWAVAERARIELITLREEYSLPAVGQPEVVVAALESKNPRIQRLARAELLRLNERAIGSLLRWLGSSEAARRETAASLLLELFANDAVPGSGEAYHLEVILAASKSPAWTALRQRAARLSRRHFPTELADAPEVERLLDELRKPTRDWDAVLPRIRALGPEGIRTLDRRLVTLTDSRPLVTETLLRLRDLWVPSPEALEALGVELHGNPEQAHAAAITLRYCMRPSLAAPKMLLDGLKHGLVHDNRTIREYSTQALAACGRAADPLVLRLLEEPSELGQFQALRVVWYMHSVHRLPMSAKLREGLRRLDSQDRDVRNLAFGALQTIPVEVTSP